ncbi:hypothetical protein FKZ61_022910 [Litorilinea aerophila]|uniref:Uncharacterized protein n=1 Tax=Litorilinea aerophila TaxID=1204385 RepID=A0A540V8L8_9CHLR|nr:hypothetical protein [Litorilinea aerophila]MCC9078949.1 hypothetical protein [Litorilinea aerophila]
MSALTLANVLPHLARYVEQLGLTQITDPTHPNHGALINPAYDLPDARYTTDFVVGSAYLALTEPSWQDHLSRATAAAASMTRAQRESGLIDLLSVNYDSSPDTGFTVQELCTVVELARHRGATGPAWAELLQTLETFIRRAVAGIASGGFHTPNHRWVMVSALVQAKALYPDLDVDATVRAYLAEGFDIDPEGAFIERSVGVYDAVNDRSVLFIAEHWDAPTALEAVIRNLTFDLHLLHADGTAETGLSRRQDYGTREVPLGLAPCYLLAHRMQPHPEFVEAAQFLWTQAEARGDRYAIHLPWLTYALLKAGDPPATQGQIPQEYARHYPVNGLWRVRRGLLSATLFRDTTRLLTFTYGAAELSSVKISFTYFGGPTGRFIGDSLAVDQEGATLRSEGLHNPRRPGYELPLGRPVPPERWVATMGERSLRRLPPLTSTLRVTEVHDAHGHGFDLHFTTLDGLDRVAAQMAFDFAPGGIWETADTRFQPVAGQTIFLKQNGGAMRYGGDVIRLTPGAYAHGMWQMREAEPAPEHVRVLLTFLTPVDHRVHVRAYRGLQP